MLKIVIIEDEQPAVENLIYELNYIEFQFKVAVILKSVEDNLLFNISR